MSYQSVDVYVVENNPQKTPVAGVMVRIYDETNRTFFTQEVTDSDGRAGFTLWTQTYNLRFFKAGAQLKQPQQMVVVEPAPGDVLVNTFEIKATVFQHPIAVDPRLCRASGFFRTPTGAAHTYIDLNFVAKFTPILLEGAAVLGDRKAIRTNEEGFTCIDLIRCARYLVTLPNSEERCVDVPDQPSVNLPDLLYPVVEQVSFDLDPTTLSVGGSLVLTPVVLASNDVPLPGAASADVIWSSSNAAVMSVAVSSTTLTLRGLSAGTAQLQAVRKDSSIVRIPNTLISGVPRTIVVS